MINRIYILIPFIFIAFVLVSCAGHQAERETVEVPPVPVITQKPERGSVTDWYRTTCELRSPLEATLSFATGGRIIELTANVGDRVKRGQYLGRVDTSTLAAQHSAALSAASSTENQARAARLAAQAADSQVEQARATMEKMEVDYNRFLNLREEGVATQAEFEQIELGYNSARLGYEAAFAGAEAAWAQARAAELGVEAAFKQASQIAELIDDGTLRAPFDGRIATKSLDQGTIAGPGMPVYKIVGDGEETGNQLEVSFKIPEIIFGRTYIGMPIYINLLSCEREIQTAINSMGPEVREGGRTVEVISYIPLDSLCLLPGMFGTVKIPLESRENVIKLPDEAVIELETEQFVYLAEGDKAVKRVVTLGLREAGFIEIVDGLTGNEDVIVIGNRYLTDGAKITLRTAGSDSVNAQGEPD